MFAAEKIGPMKLPERTLDAPAAPAGKGDPRPDLPDFDSLLGASNSEKMKEVEAEKAAAGGDLKVGESKSDKEFRQMLEKVTGKKQDKLKNKLEKDDYLNLMVTQLKNQDPTKPMDNQEMATQLAQFNTVEQLMSVNKTLGEMKAQSGAADVGKLSPYLGKELEITGNKLSISADKSFSEMALNLPAASSATTVAIKDPTGAVVRSIALGDLPVGNHKIPFDGKDDKGARLPTGSYTFEVAASNVEGKPISASQFMTAKATGIVDIATGGKLETSAGAIDVKDILAVRAPKNPQPEVQKMM